MLLLPREDRSIFLVCIGIALIFWLLIKLSRTYNTRKTVLFHFEVPTGKTFAARPPERLEVRVEGSGWELMFDYLLRPSVKLSYDLTGAEAPTELTQQAIRRSLEQNLTFNSIKIAEYNYEPINLQLESGLSKKVPVVMTDSLTFLPGYMLQAPVQFEPDSVVVSGPNSLLKNIVHWRIASPTGLKNLQSTLTKRVALRLPPPELSLNTTEVQLTVPVEQLTEKSLFIPLQVRHAPDSLRYFPEKVKVTCIIGLSKYNSIDTGDFVVEIDLRKAPLRESKHTLPIQMTRKPTEALSVQFTPKSAEFFIFKR